VFTVFKVFLSVYTPESISVTFRRRNIASLRVYRRCASGSCLPSLEPWPDQLQQWSNASTVAWLLVITMLRFTLAIRQSFFSTFYFKRCWFNNKRWQHGTRV